MSTGKTTLFYSFLIMVASLAVGMVIASRLDLTPSSSAQSAAVAAPPMNSAPLSGPVDAGTFRNIAKAMSPAVVNIRSTSKQRAQEMTEFFGGGGGGNDDLLERFFGGQGGRQRQQRPREQETQAAGTGFVINKALGYILTNNHVVEGATKVEVNFLGEENDVYHEAKIVGRDPLTDSALIQLVDKKSDLIEVKFGDSSQMQPGDWVMAIGNPFGLAHTVSVGVISATARSFPIAEQRFADVLQTDAAINPGNSGGPLLNARGEVVGINTAIYTDSRQQGNIGIGFAIPINSVRELIPQLQTGRVSRGVIGVQVSPVPADALEEFGLKDRRGALVGTVSRGKPAEKAGIEPGDVILEFNGKPVKNRDELVATVVGTKPGSTVPVKILRDKQEKTVSLTVEELDLDRRRQPRRRAAHQHRAGRGTVAGLRRHAERADPRYREAPARRGRPGCPRVRRRARQLRVPRGPGARRHHHAREPPGGAHASGSQPRARPGPVGWNSVPARVARRPGAVLHGS